MDIKWDLGIMSHVGHSQTAPEFVRPSHNVTHENFFEATCGNSSIVTNVTKNITFVTFSVRITDYGSWKFPARTDLQ